jgi:phenylacetate-coenzyme A ligase PaaK-like adenylate-forming protein
MENSKREELKKRLRNKLKQKEVMRCNKEVKEKEIEKNEELSKLGIKSKEDLERFMESIKDIDKGEIIEQLISMGLQRAQIDQFFKMFRK